MKFALTIDCSYLPGWGAREGLREILQNGRDAVIEFDAPLDVRYRKETQTLVIENDGAVIPLKALLTGFSTKREDRRLIGKYGEGLPFGLLALTRAGHKVKIRTGSEVWVPKIAPHDLLEQDVLVFDIQTGRKDEKRVAFEIEGISEETYKALPEHFLFLSKETTSDRVQTPAGTLLLDKRYAGNVYDRGIFVCHDDNLTMGYDFTNIETDRDRKMVERYNLQYHCRQVWNHAMGSRPDLIKKFIGLLDAQAHDVEGIDVWSASYLPEEVKNAVAADFLEKHGEDAVPVDSLAESAEMGHLGKTGRIVPKPHKLILEAVFGPLAKVKENLGKQAQKLYSWSELTSEEARNLTEAITLVSDGQEVSLTLSDVDITDFRDEGLRGQAKDGRVLLAKKILADRDMTLRVLIHEVAHQKGGDGEKSHVAEIERIWSDVVRTLRNRIN